MGDTTKDSSDEELNLSHDEGLATDEEPLLKDDDIQTTDDEALLKDEDVSQGAEAEFAGHWGYVVPLLMLYMISGMPMMPIVSQYMYKKVQEEMNVTLSVRLRPNASVSGCEVVNHSDPHYILQQRVQAEAANWSMYIHLAHFPVGLVMTITYGIYSDYLGRRITFILPPIGSMISCIIVMAMLTFDLPIWWFLFMAVEYLFGGAYTLLIGSFAYVADTCAPEKRALRMTIIDATLTFCAAIVELVAGLWIKYGGFLPPLYFVLLGKLTCLVYAIFFIPETIKVRRVAARSTPSAEGSINSMKMQRGKPRFSLKEIKHGFLLFFHDNGTGRRWKLNIMLLSYLLANIFGVYHIMTLFELNSPLCWDSVSIGYFNSATMAVKCVVTLLGALILRRYLSEAWIAVIARIQIVATHLYTGFVSSTTMMFFSTVLSAMAFLATPMTRAIMSKMVNKHEQGAMFAAMNCAQNVAGLISSLSVNKIYASTLFFYRGFVFLVGAFVSFTSLACVLFYIWKSAREEKRRQHTDLHEVAS